MAGNVRGAGLLLPAHSSDGVARQSQHASTVAASCQHCALLRWALAKVLQHVAGKGLFFPALQVGLVAINDGIILESCIYRILKKHFGSQQYYADLLDLFHEVKCLAGRFSRLSKVPNADCRALQHSVCCCASKAMRRLPHCCVAVLPMCNQVAAHALLCALQTTHQTAHGQLLDLITAPIGTVSTAARQ